MKFPFNSEAWLPLAHLPPAVLNLGRGNRQLFVFGKLPDGVTYTSAADGSKTWTGLSWEKLNQNPVMQAQWEKLGYTKESAETDRETATKLGVTQGILSTWLQRAAQPEKCVLARVAGFLRRVGYI